MCHAKCAGYLEYEIAEASCEETHCRKDGKNPCGSDGTQVCVTVWQRSVDNKCIGATYSCVQTSMLMTCPMLMQSDTGACLEAGSGTLFVPNQCFGEALGLEVLPTGCETQTIDGDTYVPRLFLNDQGSINYYYNFSNATLMAEYGDQIRDDCELDCAKNKATLWEKDLQSVTFGQFCLTFWNKCLMECTKEKYKDRLDSYWRDDNLVIKPGACIDPCASDSPFPCGTDENCYPINQEARCFAPFAKQAQCMLDNCPGWNSTEPPTDPVCVKVYAGIRVDDVYRGGGSVSAYTYRDSCMAKCEGFQESDWELGSCSDNAVKKCESTCGTDGPPVCAKVQVQVQIEQGDQLTIEYQEEEQTIGSECMATCLGWKDFTPGECKVVITSIEEWTGYGSQKCADYAAPSSNYDKYCFSDKCSDKESCPGDVFGMTGCQACTECNGSPKCTTEFQGPGGNSGSPCSSYAPGQPNHAYCDDKHRGLPGDNTGKAACEACPTECAASPKCSTDGFKGGPEKRICGDYQFQKKFCAEVHTGPDAAFTGKTACDACTECQGAPVCTASTTEFVNEIGKGCEYYTSIRLDYCLDTHFGLSTSKKGKSACDECSTCASAPICNAPDVGFVGFQWMTCDSYGPSGPNHKFCADDKHQNLAKDQSFKGKNACEACSECSTQWKCNMAPTGFYGYKGATCDKYAENAPGTSYYEYCAYDTAQGPDQSLKGKTACEACPSTCGAKKACNQPTDKFIGYQMEWTCAEYEMPNNLKYCDDKYTGPNVAQFGNKRACDECSGCSAADVCNDNWVSIYGKCSVYATKLQRCDDMYNGPLGSASQWYNMRGCDACGECSDAVACKNVWSFNGFGCEKYDITAQGSYNKYCHQDKANSEAPAAASWFGKTACLGCPTECSTNTNC